MVYTYPYFQYQGRTDPVLPPPATEDTWHQRWSEPVRQKINPLLAVALIASGLTFVGQPEIVPVSKWYAPFSEPVRVKPGLLAGEQSFLANLLKPEALDLESKWHFAWSEPVRQKPGLRAHLQQALISPVIYDDIVTRTFESRWHYAWSEPVRVKPGILAASQSFYTSGTILPPPINISWWDPLNEPVRFRVFQTAHQSGAVLGAVPIIVIATPFGWLEALSEPVKLPRRLAAGLNPYGPIFNSFIPTSYTARLDTTEQGADFLQAVLYQFNVATHAYVDIIEKNPHHLGNMGIIENVAQSSIVASIVEPNTTPTGGSAVPTVAGARVAIILT